jgi:hypothetical protein
VVGVGGVGGVGFGVVGSEPLEGLPWVAESCDVGVFVVPPPAPERDPEEVSADGEDEVVPPPAPPGTTRAAALEAPGPSGAAVPPRDPALPCDEAEPRWDVVAAGVTLILAGTSLSAVGSTLSGALALGSCPGSSARCQISNDRNEPATTTAPQRSHEADLDICTIIAVFEQNVHTPYGGFQSKVRSLPTRFLPSRFAR